jgi:hypothetical protein
MPSQMLLSVSEAARKLKVAPRVVSDLLYQRLLDVERCPIVGGTRIIPADYLPEMAAVIRKVERRRRAIAAAAV